MEFLLYIVLGACAGVFAGLFGVGGGLIIVPVLVFSFHTHGFAPELLTQMAVGTSLATIVFTSINSIREHQRHGAVQWPLLLWIGIGIIAGSAVGAWTAASIQGPLLQKIIGTFAIIIAMTMWQDLTPQKAKPQPGKPGLTLAGVIIGWASAIFGIGGGSLTVPYLTWRSLPMQQAVATSAACGLPIALVGSLSFIWVGWNKPQLPEWSLGYIYLPALFGIALSSMLFARFGAQLSHRLSPHLLKRLFALLLLSIGVSFWL